MTRFKRRLVLGIVVLLLLVGTIALTHQAAAKHLTAAPVKVTKVATTKPVVKSAETAQTPAVAPAPVPVAPKPYVPPADCAANALDQNIIISINQRHLWACTGTTTSYDSAVVTGMENLAADLTPTGTYHIYSKQTNLSLKGSDSTGSWDDPVSYWMPFLSNQYGVYGFHDATWRADSDFGNIDPYSDQGSHGCVELPLATAAWLYGWASIGTTVTINS